MTPAHIADAFEVQAGHCDALGSPFMGRLCRLFASRAWPVNALRDRIFAWDGDVSGAGQSISLRLAGGLHALVLQGHALAAFYPPNDVSDDELWAAVYATFVSDEAFLDAWMNSPPQTNEVRRAAVLIAVGHLLTRRFGLPLRLSELGASAGLNLMWDKFALDVAGHRFGPTDASVVLTPDWDGALPPDTTPLIAARRGVDLNPLNPRNPKDAFRLRAYLWADQPERIARTEAAIAGFDAVVDRGDAIDWLADRMGHEAGTCHLIYHTVAWQYFPADVQAKGTVLIEAAGALATTDAPLAWFGMEADELRDGAALTLRIWPGDHRIMLGRADFHGRWVKWTAPTLTLQ